MADNHTKAAFRVDRAGGFTLLELIVTIAVAAILLAVAIPSYRSMVQRNALAANVNDLVGDLNYARAQAVTRGQDVFICSSRNQTSCSTDGDWSQGWVLYVANDPATVNPTPATSQLLRAHGAADAGFSLMTTETAPLSFNSSGFTLSGNRTFVATTSEGTQSTTIGIAVTGRVEVERDTSS
ncbi:GspH/FimT family pseudopilin [Salinisphaera aquimarina]|uniref:Type II secretion system protein H n=1 Tax=Salinisphaera aquimarina TaxID=2094031 RepID=A0ABV7ESU4_9GAMM